MNRSKISHEQTLNLLKHLATNDDYRLRLKSNPRSALEEMGISEDFMPAISSYRGDESQLSECREFAEAYERFLNEKINNSYLKMIMPLMRLNYGEQTRAVHTS